MRGSLYAITEIIVFVVGASLLGLLLGLLIRRPRPQSVRAVASAGADRSEVERRLAASVERSEGLESKLNAALAKVDALSLENRKLEELRAADAALHGNMDVEALLARAALVDRLEEDLSQRDVALAEMERELDEAARRIAQFELAAEGDTPADSSEPELEAAGPAPQPEGYVRPRQNPTGPGAFTDLIEFEVGGAD